MHGTWMKLLYRMKMCKEHPKKNINSSILLIRWNFFLYGKFTFITSPVDWRCLSCNILTVCCPAPISASRLETWLWRSLSCAWRDVILRSRFAIWKPEVDEANNGWVKYDQQPTWPTITAYKYCCFYNPIQYWINNLKDIASFF